MKNPQENDFKVLTRVKYFSFLRELVLTEKRYSLMTRFSDMFVSFQSLNFYSNMYPISRVLVYNYIYAW